MARLTLTFKGKSLQVLAIEVGDIGIGRDPGNALWIDSLAIAPHHAVIQCSDEGILIRQLDQNYPVVVNSRKINAHRLSHGDRIIIGKHLLYYAEDDPVAKILADSPRLQPEITIPTTDTKPAPQAGDASFQVLKGKHIGLVIPVRSTLTRLGKGVAGTAVVVRRKEGYFLSALAAVEDVLVNDVPINDRSIRLDNGDIVKIDQHLMQFFCAAPQQGKSV